MSAARNTGLDLVRTVAIGCVLMAHAGISMFLNVRVGTIGVEIFFVLSGFLIGQILIRDFAHGVSRQQIVRFWTRRWFRTLPLYYAVVLIRFMFFDHSLGAKIIVYFFFLQNNFVGIDFMPVSWSLVIEEWFYLITPLLCLLIFRKGNHGRNFTLFLIWFIVFENLLRIVWVLTAHREYAGIVGNFPFRLDSLMTGVLLAQIKMRHAEVFRRLADGKVFIIALAGFLLLLYAFGKDKPDHALWTCTIWFWLVSFFVALQLPFLESLRFSRFRLLAKGITLVSLFTYAMYLIHPFIYHTIIRAKRFQTDWYWQVPVAMLVTFIAAGIIYFVFEKPMMDLRDKIRFRK